MRNSVLLCVNAVGLSPFANEKLFQNVSAVEIAKKNIQFLVQSLQEENPESTVSLIVIADRQIAEYSAERTIVRETWSESDFLQVLQEECQSLDQHDAILLVPADAPFLLLEEAQALLAQHIQYYAHYSFADGYPKACVPELVSVESLLLLAGIAKSDSAFTGFFPIVERDINAFDIETRISPIDFRMERLELRPVNRRSYLLCQRLAPYFQDFLLQSGQLLDGVSFTNILKEIKNEFRTLPASINWVLHSKAERPAMYQAQLPAIMPCNPEQVQDALRGLSEYCGDCVVSFSHLGEPAEYSDVYSLLRNTVAIPNLEVVVETNGIDWNIEKLRQLSQELEQDGIREKLRWIVFLDAQNTDVYTQIRPSGDFEKASSTVDVLMDLFPDAVYVQATRMDSNEHHLLDFYGFWKEKTDNIIVQKYNTYAGQLPDHRVADTGPLQRMACWRLRREMTILPDGSVSACHVDVFQPGRFGNIITDTPEEVWQKLGEIYQQHLDGALPAMCEKCDEYYTFTF